MPPATQHPGANKTVRITQYKEIGMHPVTEHAIDFRTSTAPTCRQIISSEPTRQATFYFRDRADAARGWGLLSRSSDPRDLEYADLG